MILALILISIYALLLGVLKSLQDTGMFHGGKCNPVMHWTNKYKSPLNFSKNHWWYFGLYTPKYDEHFPYSTTLLVAITDCWHRVETIRNILPFIMLAVLVKWYLIFFYLPFICIFHILFHTKKKTNDTKI